MPAEIPAAPETETPCSATCRRNMKPFALFRGTSRIIAVHKSRGISVELWNIHVSLGSHAPPACHSMRLLSSPNTTFRKKRFPWFMYGVLGVALLLWFL